MSNVQITRSQVGLAYERIQPENGRWKQGYEHWVDLPLSELNRRSLQTKWDSLVMRADYRDVKWAWRGVMTNTIVDPDLAKLQDLGGQLLLHVEEPKQPYVVIHGNPLDGFNVMGPFDSTSQALLYAKNTIPGDEWWTIRMEAT